MSGIVNATHHLYLYCVHGMFSTASVDQVARTRKEIAQLIGTVFIHKSNVNLLSSVLDTPEYFWCESTGAPINVVAQ